LIQQIQKQKLLRPAPLYPIDFELKSSNEKWKYVVNRDDANVYAIEFDPDSRV